MEKLLSLLLKNANITYLGSFAASLILVWLLHGYVDTLILYGWVVVNLLVILIRIRVSFINPYPNDNTKNKKYRNVLLLVGIAISGIVWASSSWLLFSQEDIVRQMFLIFVLLGLISASPAASGSNLLASLCFSQPIVLSLLLRFIYQGELIYYMMAVLMLLGNLALVITSFHFAKVQKRSVKAREEAEKASLAKSEFLANISHEVRTPMNAIVGINHLLKQTALTSEQQSFVDKSLVASNSLLESIENILDYSKIEKQENLIQKSAFDLRDVVHLVTTLVELDARKKQLVFTSVITKNTTPYLCGDHIKLEQILNNLVKNAVKFTDKGEVELIIRQIQQTKTKILIHFSVRDTGIGIHVEDSGKLFKPFSQVNTSHRRQYSGTGLGLSISQQLAHMMGSVIEFESKLGKGSTFFFSLWFDKCLKKKKRKKEKINTYNSSLSVLANQSGEANPLALPVLDGYELLLVEDDELSQLVAQNILSALGAKVEVAGTAQRAFDSLKKQIPSLILLDIQMPDIDGFEVIKRIRSVNDWKDIPVVCLTAHASVEEKEKALSLGMNDFLTKPIDPDELRKKLLKWLPQKTSSPEPVNSPEPISILEPISIFEQVSISEQVNSTEQVKSPEPVKNLEIKNTHSPQQEITLNISNILSMLENKNARSNFLTTAINALETSRVILQHSLSRHDWENASACAHRLRGSASLYSGSSFQQCLQDIDNNLINALNLKHTLHVINTEFDSVLTHLKSY